MARSFVFDGADVTGRVLGPVLARWRRELGWTQDELAARAGISRGYLSRLERGLPGRPGLDVLTRVCGAMGRPWTELYATAGLALPGDVTLDAIGDGLDDPELFLYLRRLPELDRRDLAVLRAVLRAFFDRRDAAQPIERPDARQLKLPTSAGEMVESRR
ncbi:MAG TPA: helix-turn-helix domain-containing protein [Thermomicrobiales bacterium]|nr:helix-turn-helix domain-containing protein [Thermomicrobiales bacterium]